MAIVRNFGPSFEKEIARVAERVERAKAMPEHAGAEDRAVVKHAVKSYAESAAPAPDVSAPAPSAADDGMLPAYFAGSGAGPDVAREVEALVSLAFSDSIEAAAKAALKHSPFVQDAFHDALADRLVAELDRRGMLK